MCSSGWHIVFSSEMYLNCIAHTKKAAKKFTDFTYNLMQRRTLKKRNNDIVDFFFYIFHMVRFFL